MDGRIAKRPRACGRRRRALLLAMLASLLAPPAIVAEQIGTPFLVVDLNAGPKPNPGSSPAGFAAVGSTLYFVASTPATGSELWKSDGTDAGTVLVKDIRPGAEMSSPRLLTNVADTLFFVADDGMTGPELWRSDGTDAGTVRVRDIRPGSEGGLASYSATALLAVGTTVYFVASDGTSGQELWKSDGSEAGTVRVADVNPGPGDAFSTFKTPLAALGATVLFVATDGANGRELWRTDGTTAGTARVADINAGSDDAIFTTELHVAGGIVLFAATDGTSGSELWKSDGSGPGTARVKDILPGYYGSGPESFTTVGTTVFFTAYGSTGRELWKTDGTEAGTVLVKDINPAGSAFESSPVTPLSLASVGGTLCFPADDGTSGVELWRSDGTAAGTMRVRDINPGAADSSPMSLTAIGGRVVFFAMEPIGGLEPWVSDGTEAGTVRLMDLSPGSTSSGSTTSALVGFGSAAFFAADDSAHGRELWETDGTPAGTVLVKDLSPAPPGTDSSRPEDLTAVGNRVLFRADDGVSGSELWRSDGTAVGTVRVRDINPGTGDGVTFFKSVALPDGSRLFAADDGASGVELWRTDGSEAGTVRVRDINPGPGGSGPSYLTELGGVIFFAADDGASGLELWRTDGTDGGTTRVRDINPGAAGSSPSQLVAALGALYFVASDGTTGYELWRSDGTEAGTQQVADIFAGSSSGFSSGAFFAEVGGALFFRAHDAFYDEELWRTDGTEAGTVRVGDIRPGPGASSPSNMKALGDTLFFVADDGTHGIELWKSDGTGPGTVLVKDLTAGSIGSFETMILVDAPQLTPMGETLFFMGTGDGYGFELWKTDGSEAGTAVVKDIRPGGPSSGPLGLRNIDGTLFFYADDGVTGEEPWYSDGTAAGTTMLADLAPGPEDSDASRFTRAGNLVFFAADGGTNGRELWAVPLGAATSGLDWFACYKTKPAKGGAALGKGVTVSLDDGTGPRTHAVRKPTSLCAPASPPVGTLFDADTHLRAYRVTLARGQSKLAKQTRLRVTNPLLVTPLTLDAKPPDRLLVPSAADASAPPSPPIGGMDHFACRRVKVTRGTPRLPRKLQVTFGDEFAASKTYDVKKPSRLCTAVDENARGISHPGARLLCYRVKRAKGEPKHVRARGVFVDNELGPERLDTVKEEELCIPSELVD